MAGLKAYERALAEQSIIDLGGAQRRATKFSTDGIVQMHTARNQTMYPNQYINLNEDNAVTQAINTIQERTNAAIAKNSTLQDLLKKEEWTYEDRALWENHVSKIISEEHDKIPGLGDYRLASSINGTRVANVADLSADIGKNGSYEFEHDCETMSFIEGIVLQRIDKDNLPPAAANEASYKYAGNYFMVSGGVQYRESGSPGGHAFIISSMTGNIIEGTADPDDGRVPYRDTGADYSFADFIAGKIAVTQTVKYSKHDPSNTTLNTDVYGQYNNANEAAVIARRQALIEQQNFGDLANETFSNDTAQAWGDHFKSAFDLADSINYTVGKSVFTPSLPVRKPVIVEPELEPEIVTKEPKPLTVAPVLVEPNIEIDPVIVKPSIDKDPVVKQPDPIVIEPRTEPVIVEPCVQLHNVSFSELVDGHGILNDTSNYNDADAIRDLVKAAKGLGLSENVYGHIEEAMDNGKFLETAAAIKAINASHAALEKANATGLSAVDTERSVLMTFFENITAENLIIDTKGHDDKTPFSNAALEKARDLAHQMDSKFKQSPICLADNLTGIRANGLNIKADWHRNAIDPVRVKTPELAANPTHIVKSGDTYSALAKRYYGSNSPEIYNALAEHNGDNPNNLKLGDKIELPSEIGGIAMRKDLVTSSPRVEAHSL